MAFKGNLIISIVLIAAGSYIHIEKQWSHEVNGRIIYCDKDYIVTSRWEGGERIDLFDKKSGNMSIIDPDCPADEATINDNKVFYTSYEKLIMYDILTKTKKDIFIIPEDEWSFSEHILVYENKIILNTKENIYVIDKNTTELMQTIKTKMIPKMLFDNFLLCSDGYHEIALLDCETMTFIWQQDVGIHYSANLDWFHPPFQIRGNNLYYTIHGDCDYKYDLVCASLADGKSIWNKPLKSFSYFFKIVGDYIYLLEDDDLIKISCDGKTRFEIISLPDADFDWYNFDLFNNRYFLFSMFDKLSFLDLNIPDVIQSTDININKGPCWLFGDEIVTVSSGAIDLFKISIK